MTVPNKNIEKFVISMLFSSLITIWHALFLPIRINSRVVLQPWLLQQGFIPYVQIGDEHAPLLPHILSWISPFFNGDGLYTARVFHSGLIGLIIFSSVWFAFNQGGRWAGIACGAYFLVASNSLGFWAMWYDLVVTPVFLLAYFVTIEERISVSHRIFWIGFISGVGFLVKQHALLLVSLIPLLLMVHGLPWKLVVRQYVKLLLVGLVGVMLPIAGYLVYFFSLTDNGYALWYWLIEFNLAGDYSSLGAKLPTLQELRAVLPLFIMLIPFIFDSFDLGFVEKKKCEASKRFWLLFVMMITAVMLYPRYSTMHWATMLPFLAISSGIACGNILHFPQNRLLSQNFKQWGLYFAIVGFLWIGIGTLNYITVYRQRENRSLIEYDGLPELAKQITDVTSLGNVLLFPDDEGVGNLYYLLEKEPPRFWLMNYPWFRNEYELDKWFEAVINSSPTHIIYFTSRGPQLYPEMNSFITQNYQTIHQLDWNGQTVEIKELISTHAHP
jgi:hypothetical protein